MARTLCTALCAAGLLAGLAGCYYRVVEPTSGTTYYTRDVDRKGSAVTFVNERDGSDVTLSNAEVEKINKREYRRGLRRD